MGGEATVNIVFSLPLFSNKPSVNVKKGEVWSNRRSDRRSRSHENCRWWTVRLSTTQ